MPYGFPKISTKECRQAILDAIAKELDKRHEFAGVGNAFFGYEFDFKLNVKVMTRGNETHLEIAGAKKVDQHPGCVEAPGCPEPVGHEGPHTETEPVKTSTEEIKVAGRQAKGKPSKASRKEAASV